MEAVQLSPNTSQAPVANVDPAASIGSEHIDWKPLYDRYNATQNPRTDRIFQEIWNWAKESAPEKDKDSIMWEISKLSNRLGSAAYGEKPWTKIHAWISTFNQMRNSEQRLKELENGRA